MNNNIINVKKGRFTLLIGAFTFLGTLLLILLFNKVLSSSHKEFETNTIRNERGTIYDTHGNILATQQRIVNLQFWHPNRKEGSEFEVAKQIATIFNDDRQAIYEKMMEKNSGATRFYENITIEQEREVNKLRRKLLIPGFDTEINLKRFYPLKEEASHILGYINNQEIGKEGMEEALDRELAPFNHSLNYTLSADAFLTIDQNIQHFTENVASQAYEDYQSEYVIFIVLNAKSGEVLAMTSRPNYDPNDLSSTNNAALTNKAVAQVFEPGSVFKIFSIGIALESGLIEDDTHYYCKGWYEIDVQGSSPIRINCYDKTAHHSQNYASIVKNSCNAGTAFCVEHINNYNFSEAIKNFDFDKKVNLGFNTEKTGFLSNPKDWSLRSKPTIAMGQEFSTTAMQIVKAATVFTNDGVLLEPYIIKKVVRKDGVVLRENKRKPLLSVLSPETAQLMLHAMEINTIAGTGKRAKIDGINISTKTGTSQFYDAQTSQYSSDAFLTSTLAIFPTEDPEIIIYGASHYPKNERPTGAGLIAPLIKKLAADCIAYYNLNKETDQIITTNPYIEKASSTTLTLEEQMPNLIGKSKRDLMPLYQYKEYDIQINGNGWVVEQFPPAGSDLTEVTEIRLELE